MKTFKIIVSVRSGGHLVFELPEFAIKDACQRLAEGIMKNGIPKKLADGSYQLEAFEAFQGEYGTSQRIGHVWYHEILGFYVVDDGVKSQCDHANDAEFNKKFNKLQFEVLELQKELSKRHIAALDKGEDWRG